MCPAGFFFGGVLESRKFAVAQKVYKFRFEGNLKSFPGKSLLTSQRCVGYEIRQGLI
jgi:hypothetical protein